MKVKEWVEDAPCSCQEAAAAVQRPCPGARVRRTKAALHAHTSGKWPWSMLTCYSDKASTKSGLLAHTGCYTVLPPIIVNKVQLALTHLPWQQEQTFIHKRPLKRVKTHVLLNFRGSFLCVFSSYRLDKRLKNSVLKTDSSKLSYSCSCRMKMSSCMVLQGNQSIHHQV